MSMRVAGFGVVALLLCGCTDADWNHFLSYDTTRTSETPPVQTASIAEPPPAPTVDSASLPPPPQVETVSPPPVHVAQVPAPSYSVTRTVVTTSPAPAPIAAAAVAPIPRAGVAIGYCQHMAQSTGASATRDGMDPETQQQVADVTYKQCMQLYGVSGD